MKMTMPNFLSGLLADSYTLYLQTHNFHWNVTGPMFQTLHQLFMAFYTEQWAAVDLIAERIRSLGAPAPGTYEEFAKLTVIKPSQGLPKARQMMIDLVQGQEAVARTACKVFPFADRADDQVTCDLQIGRAHV